MMAKGVIKLELNLAQLSAVLAVEVHKKRKIYLEWGRGTGKSFILAYFMKKMVQQMPGASFALVGSTYQQILSRTLPATKEGLEKLGVYEGYDYVVGKSGKKLGFADPIQSPDKWENIVHWSNGSIFQLVSLDNPNSGRGLNSYGVIGDESAIFDTEKLYTNVKATNRARKARFKNASLLGAEIYASSTPLTKKGKWFTNMEEIAKKKPKTHAFIKATAKINIENLRPEWFQEMKEEAPSELIYNAEIENIRPKAILSGFYPQLKPEVHYYTDYNNEYLESITSDYTPKSFNCRQDNDLIHDTPLRLSIDWGVFLSAVISQKLPKEYRVLKSLWVEQPYDIQDLLDEFCDYYEPVIKKVMYLYYGHDGNARIKGTTMTYGGEAEKILKARGWKVIDKSKGKAAAQHDAKYLLINTILKEVRSKFPSIRINEHNNQDLILSLERAEAKGGRKGIEKVKKDEKNTSMKQQHTTHLSDAFDIPIFDLYKKLIKKSKYQSVLPLTT